MVEAEDLTTTQVKRLASKAAARTIQNPPNPPNPGVVLSREDIMRSVGLFRPAMAKAEDHQRFAIFEMIFFNEWRAACGASEGPGTIRQGQPVRRPAAPDSVRECPVRGRFRLGQDQHGAASILT